MKQTKRTVKFRDEMIQRAWDKETADQDCIESGIDMTGRLYTHYANGVTTRCTRRQYIASVRHAHEQGVRYTLSGESVTLTNETRDLGHGEQIKVIYADGSTGWEHVSDLLD